MRRNGALDLEHHMFSDLPDCLPEGSLLVANNSKVLPARLIGTKEHTCAACELLLLNQHKGDIRIESVYGEGTDVTITLPAAE